MAKNSLSKNVPFRNCPLATPPPPPAYLFWLHGDPPKKVSGLDGMAPLLVGIPSRLLQQISESRSRPPSPTGPPQDLEFRLSMKDRECEHKAQELQRSTQSLSNMEQKYEALSTNAQGCLVKLQDKDLELEGWGQKQQQWTAAMGEGRQKIAALEQALASARQTEQSTARELTNLQQQMERERDDWSCQEEALQSQLTRLKKDSDRALDGEFQVGARHCLGVVGLHRHEPCRVHRVPSEPRGRPLLGGRGVRLRRHVAGGLRGDENDRVTASD